MKKIWLLILYTFVALCATSPVSAKKRCTRHKRVTKTCASKSNIRKSSSKKSPKKTIAPSLVASKPTAQRNLLDESGVQKILPLKSIDEKPKALLPSRKHRKKRAYVIRRRKVKHVPVVSVEGNTQQYSPEQLKKITKLRTIASFAWPIKKSDFYISSPYGYRRNPNGTAGFHTGVDMAASKGTPVLAAADAIVLDARPYKGYGNMILLGHRHKLFTRYAHLDRIMVKKGEIVRKGSIIGRVGNTGRVRHRRGHDGSHLHWETYIKGKRVNPRLFI